MVDWDRVLLAGIYLYIIGDVFTFGYLTFFDGYTYTAWNWLIAVPVNVCLAQIWPILTLGSGVTGTPNPSAGNEAGFRATAPIERNRPRQREVNRGRLTCTKGGYVHARV